uniref:Multidrug and toxin extrusion protein n=1 Tax=Sus scrofa TaxID=9823 RepID=A0A8D1NGJ6_PIG
MDGLQDTVPPGRGSRCPALRRLVPVGFRAEARILFVLSGPLFLFQMLNFLIYVVSSVFCGHLGKVELAAVTLSVAFVNVCGVSIGFGLSSACDTLMSQSFGSPNKKHVGVILQRGALVLLLCCLPCWALFLNTEHILLLFRQDPAVSRLLSRARWCPVPASPPPTLEQLARPCRLASAGAWRDCGSAGGLLLLGWSCQCLQDWGPFFSLAVPSMLMTCIEWWAYEIGSFLMGLLSVLDLSAQAVIYEVATVTYMIPMGLSIAVCVRVGTALGAADTVQAKRSAVSGMLCTVGAAMVVGALLSILRNKLGHIFTHDEEVVALVNKALPLYIVFHLFEATCCVYGGVLRGTGRQAFGAIVNAIMYYAVGLPLGIVLTFVVRMGILGLWLGMLACALLAAVAFVTYTARMDWKQAAEEAQKNVGLPPRSTESTAPRPGPEKVVTSSVATGSPPGVTLTTYSRPECHLALSGTPEAAQALPAPSSRLSATQLAMRRGAALGVAVATLLAGLLIRVLIARP